MRRSRAVIIFALVVSSCLAPASDAQSAPVPAPQELQHAATAFAAGDWKTANAEYTSLASRFPQSAIARFRTGVTLTELGRAAEAEASLRDGERLGAPAPNVAYRLAESLAEQKKSDAAIAELLRAAKLGFFLPQPVLAGNAHLASLLQHKEWPAVLDAFDAVARPCLHDPRFREFDFWVGDWDVRPVAAQGSGPASRNRITLEESGCIVQEHWTAAGGGTGQSFNLFDRSTGKWRQTWVDNSAGQHDYAGSLVNGNMVFEGTVPAANGQLGRVPVRLTLFHIAKDTVRQFSESTPDGGKTWTPSYDFLYVRRSP